MPRGPGIIYKPMKKEVNEHMARKNRNDEGSVFIKRKNGIEIGWIAQVTVGHYENGKPKTKQVLCKTPEEAEAKRHELLASIKLGKSIDKDTVTLGEWLVNWFNVAYKTKNADNTIELAEGHIRNHILPAIGRLVLQKIKSLDIDNFLNGVKNKSKLKNSQSVGKPLGISAKRQIRNLLKAALDRAVEDKIITFNPVRITKPPKAPKEKVVEVTPDFKDIEDTDNEDDEYNPFTIEQMQTFLKVANTRHFYLLWRLLFETGLRVGEAMALRWEKIDLETGIIKIHRTAGRNKDGSTKILNRTKTPSSKREVKVSDELLKLLKKWKAQQNQVKLKYSTTWQNYNLVFCNDGQVKARKTEQRGTPLKYNSLRCQFERILETAGLPHFNIHSTRHTWATIMIQNNIPIPDVQRLGGWASPNILLKIYAHCKKDNDIFNGLDCVHNLTLEKKNASSNKG